MARRRLSDGQRLHRHDTPVLNRAAPRARTRVLSSPCRFAIVGVAAQLAAPVALASYGQMRLDSLGALFALMLVWCWSLLLDVALLLKAIRTPTRLVLTLVIAALLAVLCADALRDRDTFAALSAGARWRSVVAAALLAFPFIAPVMQFRRLRRAQASPRWIPLVASLHVLVPAGLWLDTTLERAHWAAEFDRQYALGLHVAPGDIAARVAASEMHRRWGAVEPDLIRGFDDSTLVRAAAPLVSADREALVEIVARAATDGMHYPHLETKLIWDELVAGTYRTRSAPPASLPSAQRSALWAHVEQHGALHLCRSGRVDDADRAALLALLGGDDARLPRLDAVCRPPPP